MIPVDNDNDPLVIYDYEAVMDRIVTALALRGLTLAEWVTETCAATGKPDDEYRVRSAMRNAVIIVDSLMVRQKASKP